jgi:putative transposase
MGNLLFVTVHAANIHDTKGGGAVFAGALEKYPTIKGVCADAGYRKTFEEDVKTLGKSVEIVQRINPKKWVILPKRWIVERTFAWLTHSRRLSKDYEITVNSAEAMVQISHLSTLCRQLARL